MNKMEVKLREEIRWLRRAKYNRVEGQGDNTEECLYFA